MSESDDGSFTYYSEDGPAEIERRIREFFDPEPSFRWGGCLGRGANGVVYKISRIVKGAREMVMTNFALKICALDVQVGGSKTGADDEIEQLANEKQWLEKLSHCSHIVRMVHFDGPLRDPLSRTPSGVEPHGMQFWVYMEYLDNGSLVNLVERHTSLYPGELLPNRLLWRFFMCLVRCCLEMAYHHLRGPGGELIDIATIDLKELRSFYPGFLAHLDLSSNNICIGSEDPTFQPPEHDITPILKAIDFGTARELNPNDPSSLDDANRTGFERNVSDIGEVMEYLIRLGYASHAAVEVTVHGQTFVTWAGNLENDREELIKRGLDPDLLDLIYFCQARDPDDQLGLVELAERVRERVTNRVSDIPRETNLAIKERIRRLTMDADA